MCYYAYQSYKDGQAQENPVNSAYDSSHVNPANAFYQAIKDGKLSMSNFYSGNSNTTIWSSSESTGSLYSVAIKSGNGEWLADSKANAYAVRPICRF